MASPIKETPVLKGKDAKAFLENMEVSKTKKIDKMVKDRIKRNFDKLNSIAQF